MALVDLKTLPPYVRDIITMAQALDRANLDETEVHVCDRGDATVERQCLFGERRALSEALANAGLTLGQADETGRAIKLANKVLNTPGHDSDGDLSMMSRQFLHAVEVRDMATKALAEVLPLVGDANNAAPGTAAWHKAHRRAIELAAQVHGRTALLS
jgi:hypothetical protein